MNSREDVRETIVEAKDALKESYEGARDAIKNKFHKAEDTIMEKIHGAEEAYEEVKENIKGNYEHVKDILTNFQHEVVGSLLVFIGVFGVWLNGRLLTHLSRRETRREPLIVNLAIANIGLIVTAFPFSTLSSFQHEWAFGDNMCSYYGFVSLFFGFVIMTSTALIAIDEFMLFDWGGYINKRDQYTNMMIAYSWINALFWSITPLFGWSRFAYEPSGTSCTVMHFPDDGYTSYILGCFVACFLAPALVLYNCKMKYEVAAASTQTTQRAASLSDRTMILIIAFLVCWTPYTLVYLWPIFTDSRAAPFWLTVTAPVIAKVYTVVTPLIFIKDFPTEEVKAD